MTRIKYTPEQLAKQRLHLSKAFDIHIVYARGGAWYIPLDKLADVYNWDRKLLTGQGLKLLEPNVSINDIGEVFGDLTLYRNQIKRVELKFYLFNN